VKCDKKKKTFGEFPIAPPLSLFVSPVKIRNAWQNPKEFNNVSAHSLRSFKGVFCFHNICNIGIKGTRFEKKIQTPSNCKVVRMSRI
jgi:hypothetical protein